jgi:tellurite resistance protein
MAKKGRGGARGASLDLDEALMALFIGAMNANGHVGRDELARAHHLIWATRRFRDRSGESVNRLIDRAKRRIEEEDEDAEPLMERAARTVPARLRPAVFALIADLLLVDGTLDAGERRFLRRLAADFRMPAAAATNILNALIVKNRL